ncbi:hypothetical protein ACSLVO_30505, partial [Klebsiella pneumoniae]
GHAIEDMVRIWKARHHPKPDLKAWWARIDEWRGKRSLEFDDSADVIMPQRAIQALWDATHDRHPIITTEVGQH